MRPLHSFLIKSIMKFYRMIGTRRARGQSREEGTKYNITEIMCWIDGLAKKKICRRIESKVALSLQITNSWSRFSLATQCTEYQMKTPLNELMVILCLHFFFLIRSFYSLLLFYTRCCRFLICAFEWMRLVFLVRIT